jgi:hypothetical protein
MSAAFGAVARRSPRFPVCGDNVRVLASPSEFHDALQRNVSAARRRISLASLYFGTGEAERALARQLGEACAAHDDLTVRVLLDHSRGTRPTGHGAERVCSASVLAEHLLAAAPPPVPTTTPAARRRSSVALLQMPQLRGWKQHIPRPFEEAVAVMHLKVYAFDDTLLLTGANLSGDYFGRRQDRYVELRGAAGLASHYHDLVEGLGSCDCAFQVVKVAADAAGDAAPADEGGGGGGAGLAGLAGYALLPNLHGGGGGGSSGGKPPSIEHVLQVFLGNSSEGGEGEHGAGDGACKEGGRGLSSSPRGGGSGSSGGNDGDGDVSSRSPLCDGVADTMVLPTLQLGRGGFDGCDFDTSVTTQLLRACTGGAASPAAAAGAAAAAAVGAAEAAAAGEERPGCGLEPGSGRERALPVRLATGYFNLTDPVEQLLASSAADVDVVTASPRANGFWGAARVKGALPQAYVELGRMFLQRCALPRREAAMADAVDPAAAAVVAGWRDATAAAAAVAAHSGAAGRRLGAVRLSEYVRAGWTFHAKGLWLRLGSDELAWMWEEGGAATRAEGRGARRERRAEQKVEHMEQSARAAAGVGGIRAALDAHPALPNVTLVGSPNFGARSAERDLESQCVIATTNVALRRQLDGEWGSLTALGEGEGGEPAVAERVDDALLAKPERQLKGWGWQRGRWIRPVTRKIASFM